MYKIRKIKFVNHPILNNLELNFCDEFGNAVDTIILAGENGVGKSTILNELYNLVTFKVKNEMVIELENNQIVSEIKFSFGKNGDNMHIMYVKDNTGMHEVMVSHKVKDKYDFCGIYSDVDINFNTKNLQTVTSLNLDVNSSSMRSSSELPTQIKQLLIDIQNLDNDLISQTIIANPDKTFNELKIETRMSRFKEAFSKMFDNLNFSHIENVDGHKEVFFKKYGNHVTIDQLSSGEKQIVYRGSFLLKDLNSLKGAFVFIDEPEISMHPSWQIKIMDYYKNIFLDRQGIQTSQIFVVTHSPFVIHNDNRKKDKVIVLECNENGEIIVKDKPEYYKCSSLEIIQDAFSIKSFSLEEPTVYLEGRTDERYFAKALEVYGLNVPFKFKWIGYLDDRGQEVNTGKDALKKAIHFLVSQKSRFKNICLFDCDTKTDKKIIDNVIAFSIPQFSNDRNIKVGIENALVFGDLNIERFRKQKIGTDDYGIEKRIPEFQKMECCDYICSLDDEKLKSIFINLKAIIEEISKEI